MQIATTLLDVLAVLVIAAGMTLALWSVIGPAALIVGGVIVLAASQLAAWLAGRRVRGET